MEQQPSMDEPLVPAQPQAPRPSVDLSPALGGRSRRRSRASTMASITSSWPMLARAWQRTHAPLTSYDRLVRASAQEMSPDERELIRKDIDRSRPSFFDTLEPAADLDPVAHSERIFRVLSAWTQYDQEVPCAHGHDSHPLVPCSIGSASPVFVATPCVP